MERRDQWIRDLCAGKSFADIGGLWGTVNEKVTVAAKAGAVTTVMLDVQAPEHALWAALQERCLSMGVSGCGCVSASIDEPCLVERTGHFDVVHCSGLLYHCPNPLHTLTQLRSITLNYLILTTVVIPSTISNSSGTINLSPGGLLFVPYLPKHQLETLREHWENAEVSGAIGITEQHCGWQVDDYAPWWWLFPVGTVRQLLMAAGFRILEDCAHWGGNAHSFLASAVEPAIGSPT